MDKQQTQVFEELLKDPTFKGKDQLKHLLWLNTSTPKFAVGEFVKVTNYSHRIYGHQVVDFNAKVVKHNSFKHSNQWHYELEMEVTCDGKTKTFEEFASEIDIKGGATDNKNLLSSSKSKHSDEISVW